MKPRAALKLDLRWALCGSICFLTACSQQPILFQTQQAGISNAAQGATWYGPYPLDLGDVRDPTDYAAAWGPPGVQSSSSFYSTNDAFFGSQSSSHATPQSYGDFKLQSQSDRGVMLASFWDGDVTGGRFRPFGRVYRPVSQGGSGWAPYGPEASFLGSSSSTFNALLLAIGLGPSGSGLGLFADGSSLASLGNVGLKADGNWGPLVSQLGAVTPTSSLTGVIPGVGYLRSATDHFVNGASSSLAWDQGGHAYYGYVDTTVAASASEGTVGYLQSYTAFTNWASGNGQRLSPHTSQMQALGDGFGVTQLWVGEDYLRATSFSLGASHSCALVSGQVYCWGENTLNQTGGLGPKAHPDKVYYPTRVEGLGGSVASIAAGYNHQCAVTTQGGVFCWGADDSGQVGNGNPSQAGTGIAAPIAVTGPSGGFAGPIVQVAAGVSHTCALTNPASGGKIYCWGDSGFGKLGDQGTATSPQLTPLLAATISGATYPIRQIAAGYFSTCALDNVGAVFCVGDGTFDEIGQVGSSTTWVPVANIPSIQQISMNGATACALAGTPGRSPIQAGSVYCWGYNPFGEAGAPAGAALPASATPVDTLAYQVTVAFDHACSLHANGQAYCWGDNSKRQIGNAFGGGSAPTLVATPAGVQVTGIYAGSEGTTCATTLQGPSYCWGKNDNAEVNGIDYEAGTTTVLLPTEIPASSGQALHAYWTAPQTPQLWDTSTPPQYTPLKPSDTITQYATVSTGDVKSMSAASDPYGDVVAVYLQTDPGFVAAPTGSVSAAYPVRNANVRVFASTRGASGIWTGPTRLDDAVQIPVQTTTSFQDAWGRASGNVSTATGGIEYYTPAVTYLGNGKFMAAFATTDLVFATSSIYTRIFHIGSGWEPSYNIRTIDSIFLGSASLEPYRYANELNLASNGQGDALLTAQVVVPVGDGSSISLRNYGMKTFKYTGASDSWDSGFLIPYSFCSANATPPAALPVDPYFCWDLKPQGMLFPGGEAVVVFPAPALPYSTNANARENLRLFSTEFHL